MRVGPDGSANIQDSIIWKKRARQFLGMSSGKGPAPNFKKQGFANVAAMKALDNMLRGVGLSLSRFVPPQAPAPLKATERRYFVAADRLPDDIASSSGFLRRSVIEDSATGTRRFEVKWHGRRNLLVECIDAGSIGFPARMFLFAAGGLRGWAAPDPPHVRYDHYKTAVRKAGLIDAFYEGKIILGLRKGPWSGAAHYQAMRDVVDNLAATADCDDELFAVFAEDIACDMYKGRAPASAHLPENAPKLWEALLEAPVFEKKGSKEKASRWFDWHRQMEDILQSLACLKFVLVRMGIEQGWATSMAELCGDGPALEREDGADTAGRPAPIVQAEADLQSGAAASSADERQAREALQQSRKKTQSTLHLAASILMNGSSIRLFKILTVTARPSKNAHADQVVKCSTQGGSLHWWTEMSAGKWLQHCFELVGYLDDPAAMAEMGFMTGGLSVDDPDFILEERLGDSLFSLVIELLGTEIRDMRYWSVTFPGRFGALLSHDAEVKKAALESCMQASVSLDRLEALRSSDDSFFRDFWVNLMWPSMCWVREILMGVCENEGKSLPSLVGDELLKVALCMKTTRGCELLFNHLRECEKLQSANKMGRASRWHHCVTSGVEVEMDRKPVEPTAADRATAVATQLAPTTFAGAKLEMSLGQEAVDRYLGPKTWASPQPANLHLVAEMTSALDAVGEDLCRLKKLWLGLLAEKGCLLAKISGGISQFGIVVSVSSWAVMVWHCTVHKATDGKRFWTLSKGPASFSQMLVDDHTTVRALQVSLLPVAVSNARGLKHENGDGITSMVIVAMPGAVASPLLTFAARHAFKNMTMKQLRDLISEANLEIARPLPRSERDLVGAVMRAVLPDISDDDIAKAFEKHRRKTAQPSVWKSALNSSNICHIEGLLDADDAIELRKEVHAREVSSAVAEGKRIAAKGVRKPRKMQGLPNRGIVSREEAAAYLPSVAGCTISKDERLHYRWKVSYPADEAPFTCSKVWNQTTTQRSALLVVLRWAWAAHVKHTGEPCPYNLEDE